MWPSFKCYVWKTLEKKIHLCQVSLTRNWKIYWAYLWPICTLHKTWDHLCTVWPADRHHLNHLLLNFFGSTISNTVKIGIVPGCPCSFWHLWNKGNWNRIKAFPITSLTKHWWNTLLFLQHPWFTKTELKATGIKQRRMWKLQFKRRFGTTKSCVLPPWVKHSQSSQVARTQHLGLKGLRQFKQ